MYLLPAPQIAGLLPAPAKPNLREAVKAAFPDDSIWDGIFSAFDLMERAERLIETYIQKYPLHAPVLWDSFMLIRPQGHLLTAPDEVLDAHMRELLDRVVMGVNLRLPTLADMAVIVQLTAKQQLEADAVIPPLPDIMRRLAQEPPYKLRGIMDEIGELPAEERPTPDPQRWYDRVTLERKLDVLEGIDVPSYILHRDEPTPKPTPAPVPVAKPVLPPSTPATQQLALF
jgi:hypothetical protein